MFKRFLVFVFEMGLTIGNEGWNSALRKGYDQEDDPKSDSSYGSSDEVVTFDTQDEAVQAAETCIKVQGYESWGYQIIDLEKGMLVFQSEFDIDESDDDDGDIFGDPTNHIK